MRFADAAALATHEAWHSRRRKQEGAQATHMMSRMWFAAETDWVKMSTSDHAKAAKARVTVFDLQKQQQEKDLRAETEAKRAHGAGGRGQLVVAGGLPAAQRAVRVDDSQTRCPVCAERYWVSPHLSRTPQSRS